MPGIFPAPVFTEWAGSSREKRIGRGNDGELDGVREDAPMGMGVVV